MRKDRDGVYQKKDRQGFYFRDPATGRAKKAKSPYLSGARQELARALEKHEKQRVAQEIFGVMPPEPGSFTELCRKFMDYQKMRLTPAAYERERFIVERHFIPYFPTDLREITPLVVEDYIARRLAMPARKSKKPGAKTVSGSTVAKERNTGNHLFRWAVKNHLAISNPWRDVAPPRQNRPRTRWLTPLQVRTILENSPYWLQPIVGLAVSTGMRRGELLTLHHSEINLENQTAFLPQTKNGDSRLVPLNDFALTVIRSLPPNPNPNGLLFPDIDPLNVSVSFQRACRRAGINGFTFHDLRHTFASYLRQQGHDLDVIARTIGHRTLSMASRYAHVNDSQVEAAVDAFDTAFDILPVTRP
jgi:integrase